MEKRIKGKSVIEQLSKRFPQLYVAPAEDATDEHRMASGRGIVPDGASLSHFQTSSADELRMVDTPAGPVDVVFLKNRTDFETFLQVIGHKARPVPIARTVGAITYRGLADWQAVAQARATYLAAGGTDWPAEFSRLARQPGAFRAEIVIISEGPYSNVPAHETPFDPEKWLRVSREIRLHHECAHVVCRRTMPEDILPVWDEVTADVTGLLCATGCYDASLAARFLGVTPMGFAGGRLTEYLDDEQKTRLAVINDEVYAALTTIEKSVRAKRATSPFDFLLDLKRNPLVTY